MTQETFDAILENRIAAMRTTMASKSKEYAKGSDKLYNFKRAAQIERTTPEKAWLGMWMKHIVSVIDIVEAPENVPVALLEEKIGDSVNYLILLEAMQKERIAQREQLHSALEIIFNDIGKAQQNKDAGISELVCGKPEAKKPKAKKRGKK